MTPTVIYDSAPRFLGLDGGEGAGGIFLMDANTFELKGQWEKDQGPQNLANASAGTSATTRASRDLPGAAHNTLSLPPSHRTIDRQMP